MENCGCVTLNIKKLTASDSATNWKKSNSSEEASTCRDKKSVGHAAGKLNAFNQVVDQYLKKQSTDSVWQNVPQWNWIPTTVSSKKW